MKYFIANWKANKNLLEATDWVSNFNLSSDDHKKVVLAPAFTLLSAVKQIVADKGLNISLAVQDISPFPAGSYTGAISTRNIENMEIEFAILGHSERRRYFKETLFDVANKIEQSLEAKITPILCVDDKYLINQARAIQTQYLDKCLVAYEPLVAIGSGNNATVNEVREIAISIKKLFGKVPVLYGGSVTAQNVGEYQTVVDGFLVGGASLNAKSFAELIQSA